MVSIWRLLAPPPPRRPFHSNVLLLARHAHLDIVAEGDHCSPLRYPLPTMLVPIQYALTYPERRPGLMKPFDFIQNNTLQFQVPDLNKFRCLHLAFEAIKEGSSLPCYMNAANEVLVNRFLKREIGWMEIGERLEKLMSRHKKNPILSIEAILEIDKSARHEAMAI